MSTLTRIGSQNANWQLIQTGIPGCMEARFPAHPDERGVFVKTFQCSAFQRQGLETNFVEVFYTVSGENVLRGMHLQLPPANHAKLIYCIAGSVSDAVLDLRQGSPSYGKHAFIELSAGSCNGVYLPSGVAHGFCVRTAPAIIVYHVTAEHTPHLDVGVAWNSFEAVWPTNSPIVSARDASLPPLADFDSPFTYTEHAR